METDPQKLNDLIQQGTKILDDWVPALVFGDAVIIDGFTTRPKGCARKDRVTLFVIRDRHGLVASANRRPQHGRP